MGKDNNGAVYKFLLRDGHIEPKLVRTLEADMDEDQVRRECLDILGDPRLDSDCPMGVDVYKNGEYLLSENIDDE